ncbi:hypothetical protein HA466_0182200 [Hirschfeldia incana]|nr:hypothetical protein HA466_0182200 [Hirschfeldia incana]KAJ0245812.1 hypothetical protein HA466_0182200 [Hirschfeldia incana]
MCLALEGFRILKEKTFKSQSFAQRLLTMSGFVITSMKSILLRPRTGMGLIHCTSSFSVPHYISEVRWIGDEIPGGKFTKKQWTP